MVTLKNTNIINAHLMPGSLFAYQDNTKHMFKNTDDMVNKAYISILVNRDVGGYSKGSLFLDKGLLRDEITDETYEYFKF